MKTMRFFRGTILSVSLGALVACSSFFVSDSYYGVKTGGKNIVFVIDISGSMEGRAEGNISDQLRAQAAERLAGKVGSMIGGRIGGYVSSGIASETTKLASAKRELKPAIMGLNETTRFTIVTFSDGVATWKDDLTVATKSDKAIGYAFVMNLSTQGGTSAMAGIARAFMVPGVDTIFFLSDGYPSDAGGDQIVEAVKAMNQGRGIQVNTIGLGDDKDEKFLKKLAKENGGKYIEG
ncbi:MAG: VWA domain-containing protein [Spirochaetes bacterium]|nr:MAG: VWA domain-containing protein [Spirochaetota bacterium]